MCSTSSEHIKLKVSIHLTKVYDYSDQGAVSLLVVCLHVEARSVSAREIFKDVKRQRNSASLETFLRKEARTE